jgi:hypothetical protein
MLASSLDGSDLPQIRTREDVDPAVIVLVKQLTMAAVIGLRTTIGSVIQAAR